MIIELGDGTSDNTHRDESTASGDCGPDTRFRAPAKAHDPDDVADLVAHDAAVGLPGFKPILAAPAVPVRGSVAWAERVMLGGTPVMKAIKRAASHVVVLALAETVDDLGDAATPEAIIEGVAHAILPRQALLDLIATVEEMRQLDTQHRQLVDEATTDGHENKQDAVNRRANDRARDALAKALELLGVTE